MADDANSLFKAAIPEPFRILGLQLRPFSLGHYVTLHRHDCAFVSDDERGATRDDLIFACIVCSMTWEEFNEWIESKPITRMSRARLLWRLLTFRLPLVSFHTLLHGTQAEAQIHEWGRQAGLFDLKEKVELFQRYVMAASVMPKFWIEREGGPESGSHWSHAVFLTLTGELGFSPSQAWNLPLREALLHFFKHGEANGAVRLMTQEEIG